MKVKKVITVLTSAVLALQAASGCTQIHQEIGAMLPIATATTTATQPATHATETAPAYEEIKLEVPEITREDVDMVLEAEDEPIPDHCAVEVYPRLGYSGSGYMSGISAIYGTKLDLEAEIPYTQHYDVTIVVGCFSTCTCKIEANGDTVYTLQMDAADNFLRATIEGVFLSEGAATLTIEPTEGTIDIDCVELTDNESLYSEDAEISNTPVDPQASTGAKTLYQFMLNNYGKKIMTGQYASTTENFELEQIYLTTGKYPLIRMGDIGGYADGATPQEEVRACLDWARQGGIAGLCWYWKAPSGGEDVYAENTTFSLSDAVTDIDVANATTDELHSMIATGEINESTYALLEDIDEIAAALRTAANADVPILWRPLMEASGGWYWWGASGVEAYTWLWDLLYTRLTSYHDLHNLIWIWNGQSDSYMVDAAKYDIAALDLYVEGTQEEFGSRYEQFVALRGMVPGKMLAISECSHVPDMNTMFRDNAVWSFFALWYEPYLGGTYSSDETMIEVYNSEASLTRGDY